MKKRVSVMDVLLILIVVQFFIGSPAFAYGEEIQSSLTTLLNWITKVLGGLAVGFGLVWTGIRVGAGDENAGKTGLKIVGGGILCFSAMNIVDLLQNIFGVH
jgi:threonine/homoserine/homoserine lactone efflux protein